MIDPFTETSRMGDAIRASDEWAPGDVTVKVSVTSAVFAVCERLDGLVNAVAGTVTDVRTVLTGRGVVVEVDVRTGGDTATVTTLVTGDDPDVFAATTDLAVSALSALQTLRRDQAAAQTTP